jgi:hypothetical protein
MRLKLFKRSAKKFTVELVPRSSDNIEERSGSRREEKVYLQENISNIAEVAELVDAHGLGPCVIL